MAILRGFVGRAVFHLLLLSLCQYIKISCGLSVRDTQFENNETDCSKYERPHISEPKAASSFYSSPDDLSYHQPIHWVFHLNPPTNHKTIRDPDIDRDFSERVIVPRSQNQSVPLYLYSANFQLLHYGLDDMLFSCEPVSLLNKCERNFLQVLNQRLKQKPTSIPSPSLSSLSDALFNSHLKPIYEPDKLCTMLLNVWVVNGNTLDYKWEMVTGAVKGRLEDLVIEADEATYLDNVYRVGNESKQPNCARLGRENETCVGCKTVTKEENGLNGVAFHAKYNELAFVYKGIFSVPKESHLDRKFYFLWQISQSVMEEEMVQMQVPSKIYANVSFVVECRVSIYLFAYGTIISDKASPDVEEEDSRSTLPKEYFQPFGYRKVNQSMMFESSHQMKQISCFAPLKKSPEWITKSREIFVEEAIRPAIDDSSGNITKFHSPALGEMDVVAECNVTGNPTPTLKWTLPSTLSKGDSSKLRITKEEGSHKILFPAWEPAYFGKYICEAHSIFGVTIKSITFQQKPTEFASTLAIAISSTVGVFAVILAAVIGFLAWRIRNQRLEFERQTQKAIEEFKNGIEKAELISDDEILDPNFSVMQLPYNESFEIPKALWNIEEKVLGSGQFGVVKMGDVLLKGERIKVAVKSLKSTVEIDEFKSFLFELKIMAYLGHNKNIVSLVAACTEGIDDRDISIGVEFCDNGCLLEYLRKFRGSFRNMVTIDGKLAAETCLMNDPNYANICTISTYDLYRWAYHVACGMDYLRLKKVLHGDLAARNVLLNARRVAKVGDFGLSRVLMDSKNYIKKSQTPLPWKWMAIESLKFKTFSVSSDVWAYGVFLYELYTCGQTPYPGVGWSPDFPRQLENGLRMEKPVYCTESMYWVYNVMKLCWDNDPNHRPSYLQIKRKLSKGLSRLSEILRKTQHLPSPTSPLSPIFPPSGMSPIEIDDAGIYSNLPRRTMNYYKN